MTLIDFSQIGKIIYNQHSIFTKVEDIIDKIKSATDLNNLRSDILEGNYVKYFQDTFEQRDFQKKWEKLTSIRNKVAHNNYFIEQDLIETEALVKELNSILNEAIGSIEAFSLSIADKEAVVKAIDNFVSEETEVDNLTDKNFDNNPPYDFGYLENGNNEPILEWQPGFEKANIITENELLDILNKSIKNKDFLGLKFLVRDVLGKKGFSYNSSYALINLLADKGKLEIYQVDNPKGIFKTTAIKLIDSI